MIARTARFIAHIFVLWLSTSTTVLLGQHQTETFSPVVTEGWLPYEIELAPYDLGATPLPTLHSFASARWDGKWLLVGGRTNGLHAFTQNGFANFPPSFANRDVWVVDPVKGESWRRSLDDVASGLSVAQIDSLSVTNAQFFQADDRLYITGGYGYQTDFDFVTFDALTAIDVPGLIDWVQGSNGPATNEIRQIHDPLFTVTGGAMHSMDGRMHLVFGQDFQGEYTPFGNGEYTKQVRSFTILDDGDQLAIQNAVTSEADDNYRRRDLNVVPVIRSQVDGSLSEELRVLSGVFTPEGGTWTVPVEINTSGVPLMVDPEDPNTFKQAMNVYHSAKVGLYSESSDEMHMLLFGGISPNYFDHESQQLIQDDFLPFINQSTSIVIDGHDNYTQYLLPEEFPEVYDEASGNRLLFGTNAEFMLADGVPTYDNGVVRFDEIDEPTLLGYILGGIAADKPNQGNSAASGRIFQVIYTPVDAIDGDFNHDGNVDVKDISLLIGELRTAEPDSQYDVDDSGTLDANDLVYMVEDVLQTWFGDANLDGEFNSADLVEVFQAGEYEDGLAQNSRWDTGDWNGDGDFGSSDFVIAFERGGYEQGPRILSVPETGFGYGIFWCLLTIVYFKHFFNCRNRTAANGKELADRIRRFPTGRSTVICTFRENSNRE